MFIFDTHFHVPENCDIPAYKNKVAQDFALTPELPVSSWGGLAQGGNLAETNASRLMAESGDNFFFSAGIHPLNVAECRKNGETPEDYSEFFRHSKCVAVGEIGLDYYYDYQDAEEQRSIFMDFLQLAAENQLPAVIHLRDRDGEDEAYRDALAMISEFAWNGGRFVVHCFAGGTFFLKKFLELGGYVGFTGMVTFKKADNIRKILQAVPLDRILLETDAPYLAPLPFRGRDNSPGLISRTLLKIAEERRMEPPELLNQLNDNAAALFNLKLTCQTSSI